MSAELAGRRTAAAAALVDFRRAADKYLDDITRMAPRPDYSMWAWRLASELGSVLQRLDTEAAEVAPVRGAGQLAEIRQVLGNFDSGRDDLQYALERIEQIVDRNAA